MSSSTMDTTSTATASVASVALPAPTTITSTSTLSDSHFREPMFLLIFDFLTWEYICYLAGQVGHCNEKICPSVFEKMLLQASIYELLDTLIFSSIFLTIWFSEWFLPLLFNMVKSSCNTVEKFSNEYVRSLVNWEFSMFAVTHVTRLLNSLAPS